MFAYKIVRQSSEPEIICFVIVSADEGVKEPPAVSFETELEAQRTLMEMLKRGADWDEGPLAQGPREVPKLRKGATPQTDDRRPR